MPRIFNGERKVFQIKLEELNKYEGEKMKLYSYLTPHTKTEMDQKPKCK